MKQSVYVIESEAGPVKIGIAANPGERLKRLIECQPFEARIVHVETPRNSKASAIERAAHVLLASQHCRGEWFNVTKEQAVEAVRQAALALESGIDLAAAIKRANDLTEGAKAHRAFVRRLCDHPKLTWQDCADILGPPFSQATLRRLYGGK